jgi:hypothetical protein
MIVGCSQHEVALVDCMNTQEAWIIPGVPSPVPYGAMRSSCSDEGVSALRQCTERVQTRG